MSEESFGTGIALDEDFDLSIDNVGDIQEARGVDELQKDLAVQLSIGLDKFLGSKPTPNAEAAALATAVDIVEADPRVDFVFKSSADASFEDNGLTIALKLPVQTINGEQFQFVYEV